MADWEWTECSVNVYFGLFLCGSIRQAGKPAFQFGSACESEKLPKRVSHRLLRKSTRQVIAFFNTGILTILAYSIRMYLVLLNNRKGDVLNPKYEKQIKKGVLEILVLKLLENDEKYGYQLISELKEKSGGMFTLKEGTLYPILYRLEDEGLVISRWREPKGKEISRKYYQITYKGGQELKELCELWNDFQKNVKEILEG